MHYIDFSANLKFSIVEPRNHHRKKYFDSLVVFNVTIGRQCYMKGKFDHVNDHDHLIILSGSSATDSAINIDYFSIKILLY